jgi:vancomycin permeability regulator SanA
MNIRVVRIAKFLVVSAALLLFVWISSVIAVYTVSSGRVFDRASITAVPHQRAAVVLGCSQKVSGGRNNLYFFRRINAASELYKAGKVDAIVLTGGIAHSKMIVDDIIERVGFIAPVVVYAGENELESLAENGYGIMAGEFDIKYYHPDHF